MEFFSSYDVNLNTFYIQQLGGLCFKKMHVTQYCNTTKISQLCEYDSEKRKCFECSFDVSSYRH